MNNFLKKIKNKKYFSNTNIIIISLIVAIFINFFILNWSQIEQNLKASIINSQLWINQWDIYLSKNERWINMLTNKSINDMNNFSFTINYNPKNITIISIESTFWEIAILWDTPWMNLIMLTANNIKNIKKWDKILKINIKKNKEISENINITNANFSDYKNEKYLLTTSWITF